MRRLRRPASLRRLLFFTDDRDENIESAVKLGIRGHQFHSVLKLVNALQSNGVQLEISFPPDFFLRYDGARC